MKEKLEVSMGNYYKLLPFIKELVNAGDTKSLEAFFTHVYPVLPVEAQNDLSEFGYGSAIEYGKEEVVNIFVNHLGFRQEEAINYLNSRIKNYAASHEQLMERSLLDQSIKGIGDAYGAILLSACIAGDIEIVRKLVEKYGVH